MRSWIVTTTALLALPVVATAEPAPRPQIDIVFAIDCSGSMQGVIDTAKQKVWSIVNTVAKGQPAPALRIGLIGYGSGERIDHFVDLSDDLDNVYSQLTQFNANAGGSEYVGLVIDHATQKIAWSTDRQALRVLYVIGNETARQGPEHLDYSKTTPQAIARDIVVNAIYCGDVDHASATPTWREIAKLADGQYLEIAAEGGAVVVATPMDAELARLNVELNQTYLAFGAVGQEGQAQQLAQDAAAASQPAGASVVAERAAAKTRAVYNNARWDLVDAVKQGKDLSRLEADDLPADMRALAPEQRQAYVEEKARQRADVQAKIQKLASDREAFIRKQIETQGLNTDHSLEQAVRQSLVEQAQRKGIDLGE